MCGTKYFIATHGLYVSATELLTNQPRQTEGEQRVSGLPVMPKSQIRATAIK